jgi:hypothetical protein
MQPLPQLDGARRLARQVADIGNQRRDGLENRLAHDLGSPLILGAGELAAHEREHRVGHRPAHVRR